MQAENAGDIDKVTENEWPICSAPPSAPLSTVACAESFLKASGSSTAAGSSTAKGDMTDGWKANGSTQRGRDLPQLPPHSFHMASNHGKRLITAQHQNRPAEAGCPPHHRRREWLHQGKHPGKSP